MNTILYPLSRGGGKLPHGTPACETVTPHDASHRACRLGRRECSHAFPCSRTVFCRPIAGVRGLVFAGKRDNVGRAQSLVPGAAREMIDFAVAVSPYITAGLRGLRCPSSSGVCPMTRSLLEDIRQAIPRQHDAAFGKRLDGRDVVCGEDLRLVFVYTAVELPLPVGAL